MEGGYHPFTILHHENSPENSEESPPSPLLQDTKATSKRSRRGAQKRVVHVPLEGSRLIKGGETNAPPPDSWAWRKYGQKPIKGSPYPRGYYRCSSSKGCPARKQVERSRSNPTMVMVTYSCEHNHPWPASRNINNHHHFNTPPSPSPSTTTTEEANINTEDQLEEPPIQTGQFEPKHELKPEPYQKLTRLEMGSCGPLVTTTNQYNWFSDLDSTSSTMLESPLIMARDMVEDSDMTKFFSIREDEESFFADLGELPECSTVFRRREIERAEEHCRNLTPRCGATTG